MSESALSGPAMPYPWQAEQWEPLSRQFVDGRLPHALMLNGPAMVGKGQFARALAQLALCAAPMGGYACGRCKSCKLIAAGSHPDLLVAQPEEEGKAVKIDQIRQVSEFVAKTSQQGGWKVAIIEPAEAMNVNASNALLKSLEEPSDNTLLILVCHQVTGVPATIRSRCRMTPFAVPAKQYSLPWLQSVVGEDKQPEQLLEQAAGRPLLAVRLIEGDLLEQRDAFYDAIEQVGSGTLSPVLAAERCYKQNALQLLEWFIGRLEADARKSSLSEAGLARMLFRYHDRLLDAKRELQSSSNPNLQLLWESLLLDWQALSMQLAAKRSRKRA